MTKLFNFNENLYQSHIKDLAIDAAENELLQEGVFFCNEDMYTEDEELKNPDYLKPQAKEVYDSWYKHFESLFASIYQPVDDTPPKLYIYLEGGLVRGVYSSIDHEVIVQDDDIGDFGTEEELQENRKESHQFWAEINKAGLETQY